MDTVFTLQVDHDDICTILHVSMTSMWNKVRQRHLAYFSTGPKEAEDVT